MAAINIIAAFCLLLSSCINSDDIVYTDFQSVDEDGWVNNQYIEFQLDSVVNQQADVDVLLVVRYSEGYDYELLCLVNEEIVSTCDVKTDTIEIKLADSDGRLIGRGQNGLYEVVDTLHRNLRINDYYSLSLAHGMREKSIKGINDIGIIIKKHN